MDVRSFSAFTIAAALAGVLILIVINNVVNFWVIVLLLVASVATGIFLALGWRIMSRKLGVSAWLRPLLLVAAMTLILLPVYLVLMVSSQLLVGIFLWIYLTFSGLLGGIIALTLTRAGAYKTMIGRDLHS